MTSYNLLTEAWIPVCDNSGNIQFKGILDTLRDAHKSARISDPSPPVQFGIYRLLIAFVLDVYTPQIPDDLEDMLKQGKFNPVKLEEYANTWKDRFDLFDQEHPFMQSTADPTVEKKVEPIARLMQHLPSGTNVMHFHHGYSYDHAFSYEQCARGLVTIPPFMTSGGAGLSPSINGNPPWYILIMGDSLFKTIIYNICTIPPLVIPMGSEPVAWRSEKKVEPKKEVKIFSMAEGLTWRPRRIRLLPGGTGRCTYTGKENVPIVKEMYYGPGLRASGEWVDPQVPYKITDKGRFSIKPEENKDLWRDTGPIMLLMKQSYGNYEKIIFERPAVISQFKQLIDDGFIPDDSELVVEAYGIRTDGNMKFFEWRIEILSLPYNLLNKKNTGIHIQRAMDYADLVSYYLKLAIKKAYPRDGKSNENALNSLIKRSQITYWTSLESLFKEQFLKNLSDTDSEDLNGMGNLMEEWKKTLKDQGMRALEEALGPLDSDSKELHRQVDAKDQYLLKIKLALFPETVTNKKRSKRKESKAA